MTSLIRKVLRGSSKKKKGYQYDSRNSTSPICPPSPDLSTLTSDELIKLKDVFRRQDEFEMEVGDREQRLRESLMSYEDEVKRHAGQKNKLKHIDLRLCRLCYKTKFADGIGKMCQECNTRVCNRCGSFSKSSWNAKKQKTVKGKWRCNICQMKRNVVAMTGGWYHGNREQAVTPSTKLKSKFSASELDTSEDDNSLSQLSTGEMVKSLRDTTTGDNRDTDECTVFSDETIVGRRNRRKSVSHRRRSSSSLCDVIADDPDVENEIDVEQFQRERNMCRRQRQNKYRKRVRCDSITEWAKVSQDTEYYVSSGENLTCEGSSSAEQYISSEMDRETNSDSSPYPGLRRRRSTIADDRLIDYKGHNANNDYQSRVAPPPLRDVSNGRYKRTSTNHVPDRRSSSNAVHSATDRQHLQNLRSRSLENSRAHDDVSYRPRNSTGDEVVINKKRQNRNQNKPVPFSNNSSNYHTGSSHHDPSHQNPYKELRNARENQIARESRVSRGSLSSRESRYSRESYCSIDTDTADNESRNSVYSRGSVDYLAESPTCHTLKASRRKLLAGYNSSSNLYSDHRQFPTTEQSHRDMSPSRLCRPRDRSNSQRDIASTYNVHKLNAHNTKRFSCNSLSPDMALFRSRPKFRQNTSTNRSRSGSISPNSAATFEDTVSRTAILRGDNKSRRNTFPYMNITTDIKVKDKPTREVLLRRNKADQLARSQGLGMRVVGGRSCSNGTLGAFVTNVIKGGVAESHDIAEGDQVTEWNGRSMLNVTFEEAQTIVNSLSDTVQISIIQKSAESKLSQGSDKHPIIIRSDMLGVAEVNLLASDMGGMDRKKRRMLPKTPVEIKRDVRRISGRVWIRMEYDVTCRCLLLVLLRGEGIMSEGNDGSMEPNVVIMLHLLPNRTLHEAKESEIRYNSKHPHWNETFIFANIDKDELHRRSLEITAWNFKEPEDEFLGEVLLDLGEANIDNSVQCYDLEDHDENSSPLPYRKKSFCLSDSALSSVTSLDASSLCPSRDPSPKSSVSTKEFPQKFPSQERRKELTILGRKSQCKLEMSSSAQSSPLHSPVADAFPTSVTTSTKSLAKRKIGVVARVSSTLGLGIRAKRDSDTSDPGTSALQRSQSDTDMRGQNLLNGSSLPQQLARRSFGKQDRFGLLAPPHPLIIPDSSALYDDSLTDADSLKSPNPDRPAPEGDDITSLLGPGQVSPKPHFETSVSGDIKMGFMVSKGQLEIDIVVVKGLIKGGLRTAPDTYVKTYLVEGSKTVQKKKTQTVRMSFDPIFRKTIKYSACNIHGRCIKVNVWEKQKTFDRKQCLGEAVVKLDNLDLCRHTVAWYKLFPVGATELGSSESLNDWPYH